MTAHWCVKLSRMLLYDIDREAFVTGEMEERR